MSFEVVSYANRTDDFTVTLKTAAGGYLQLAATDEVRCKIGRNGTVTLDLDSVAATANGSVVTIDQVGNGSTTHAQVTVRLAQGDTSGLKGPYECEVLVVDDSEASPVDAIKLAERGVVHVIGGSLSGDVGLT